MANTFAIDVYTFSTGMAFDQKYTEAMVVADVKSVVPAAIYDFKGNYFSGVKSKITKSNAGVLKDYYVAQTVAAVQSLMG